MYVPIERGRVRAYWALFEISKRGVERRQLDRETSGTIKRGLRIPNLRTRAPAMASISTVRQAETGTWRLRTRRHLAPVTLQLNRSGDKLNHEPSRIQKHDPVWSTPIPAR